MYRNRYNYRYGLCDYWTEGDCARAVSAYDDPWGIYCLMGKQGRMWVRSYDRRRRRVGRGSRQEATW